MSLGRGLDSLIPDKKAIPLILRGNPPEEGSRVLALAVSLIDPNPHQPRKNFKEKELQELSDSIKEHGVLQPVVVTPLPGGRYELVVGERRLRATKLAGLTTIPAVVRTTEDQQKLELALIENIQRENLNPIEEALAYRKLRDEFGLTQKKISEQTGKSEPVITSILRLLDLPQEMQDAVSAGRLAFTNARAIASGLHTNPEGALKLWHEFEENKTGTRELEREAAQRNSKKRTKINPVVLEKQKELEQVFGTKVHITSQHGRSSIIFQFFSDEEFHAALERLLKA